MNLRELEAEFVRSTPGGFEQVETIAEAEGLWFLCPKCFKDNGGKVRTHMILCWNPLAPADRDPRPGRGLFAGTSLDDLTLDAVPPEKKRSVLLLGGCNAHFHVTAGEIT
jgi:hypothetical protein